MDCNLYSWIKQKKDKPVSKELTKWLMVNGLLKNEVACECCGQRLLLKEDESLVDGFKWVCTKCRVTVCVRRGSIFSGKKLKLEIVLSIWVGFVDDSLYMDLQEALNVSRSTIVKTFCHLRRRCIQYFDQIIPNDPNLRKKYYMEANFARFPVDANRPNGWLPIAVTCIQKSTILRSIDTNKRTILRQILVQILTDDHKAGILSIPSFMAYFFGKAHSFGIDTALAHLATVDYYSSAVYLYSRMKEEAKYITVEGFNLLEYISELCFRIRFKGVLKEVFFNALLELNTIYE